jgi:hypothetical protein
MEKGGDRIYCHIIESIRAAVFSGAGTVMPRSRCTPAGHCRPKEPLWPSKAGAGFSMLRRVAALAMSPALRLCRGSFPPGPPGRPPGGRRAARTHAAERFKCPAALRTGPAAPGGTRRQVWIRRRRVPAVSLTGLLAARPARGASRRSRRFKDSAPLQAAQCCLGSRVQDPPSRDRAADPGQGAGTGPQGRGRPGKGHAGPLIKPCAVPLPRLGRTGRPPNRPAAGRARTGLQGRSRRLRRSAPPLARPGSPCPESRQQRLQNKLSN